MSHKNRRKRAELRRECAARQDCVFLDELVGSQLDMSDEIYRQVGDDYGELARAIAWLPRKLGEIAGRVRWRGHDYYFELFCTDPTGIYAAKSPSESFGTKRFVYICNKKEME